MRKIAIHGMIKKGLNFRVQFTVFSILRDSCINLIRGKLIFGKIEFNMVFVSNIGKEIDLPNSTQMDGE